MKLDDPVFLLLVFLLGFGFVVVGVLALRVVRSKRSQKRPVWDRLMAETDYFRKAMAWVFKRRGFRVVQSAVIPVQSSEGPREILFRLEKNGRTYSALCGRWVAVVGSDQVLRYQEQLARSFSVQGAMLITTGKFTPSAHEQAAGTPLALHDGIELREWING